MAELDSVGRFKKCDCGDAQKTLARLEKDLSTLAPDAPATSWGVFWKVVSAARECPHDKRLDELVARARERLEVSELCKSTNKKDQIREDAKSEENCDKLSAWSWQATAIAECQNKTVADSGRELRLTLKQQSAKACSKWRPDRPPPPTEVWLGNINEQVRKCIREKCQDLEKLQRRQLRLLTIHLLRVTGSAVTDDERRRTMELLAGVGIPPNIAAMPLDKLRAGAAVRSVVEDKEAEPIFAPIFKELAKALTKERAGELLGLLRSGKSVEEILEAMKAWSDEERSIFFSAAGAVDYLKDAAREKAFAETGNQAFDIVFAPRCPDRCGGFESFFRSVEAAMTRLVPLDHAPEYVDDGEFVTTVAARVKSRKESCGLHHSSGSGDPYQARTHADGCGAVLGVQLTPSQKSISASGEVTFVVRQGSAHERTIIEDKRSIKIPEFAPRTQAGSELKATEEQIVAAASFVRALAFQLHLSNTDGIITVEKPKFVSPTDLCGISKSVSETHESYSLSLRGGLRLRSPGVDSEVLAGVTEALHLHQAWAGELMSNPSAPAQHEIKLDEPRTGDASRKFTATLQSADNNDPILSVAAILADQATCPTTPADRRYQAGFFLGQQIGGLFAREMVRHRSESSERVCPQRTRNPWNAAWALGSAGVPLLIDESPRNDWAGITLSALDTVALASVGASLFMAKHERDRYAVGQTTSLNAANDWYDFAIASSVTLAVIKIAGAAAALLWPQEEGGTHEQSK